MTQTELKRDVEIFLLKNSMAPTQFGSLAVNDPNFVRQLREGERSLTLRTVDRVRKFMSSFEGKKP
jgi:hypothetical protein